MKQKTRNIKGSQLKCRNIKCGHRWTYKGKLKSEDYITCTKCRYRYKKRSMIKEAKAKLTNGKK